MPVKPLKIWALTAVLIGVILSGEQPTHSVSIETKDKISESLVQFKPGNYPNDLRHGGHPEVYGSYPSPNGRYVFVIKAITLTKKDPGTLVHMLMERKDDNWQLLWSKTFNAPPYLTQNPYILINDAGQVLVTDRSQTYSEIHNQTRDLEIREKAAFKAASQLDNQSLIYLYNIDGNLTKTYALADLSQVLDVTVEEIILAAKSGYWRQSSPQFGADGQTIEIEAADQLLTINLETGELRVS